MLSRSIHPAIFLDKDGTLLENVPYNVDPSRMRFSAGAVQGLRLLKYVGYQFFVITNQSGVARGLFPEEALTVVRRRLQQMLEEEDIRLSGFYYCPHHPLGKVRQYSVECFCRKPNPGLLFRAAREHDLNLTASWFIGDTLDDIECGLRANCGTILINNGNKSEWKGGPIRQPHFTAPTLRDAAHMILTNPRPSAAPLFSHRTFL